ncbi:hypothetical protein [Luteimonas qiangzhengi]|uniref:hypothetical protein n=1 Tax=Luteimonas sp. MJ146 TaxID=3129240 RepID=UPI0031BB7215
MSVRPHVLRTGVLSALAIAVLATSGCGWFRKENPMYAASPENRPLEVPPDLDRPSTAGAMVVPEVGSSVTRSGMSEQPAASSAVGFSVAGARDAVYEQVGQVLAATEGLSVVSSAQLLGTYDLSYEDSNFMIRIVATEGGSHVSAVDPRGQPAQGDAARKLIELLRAQIGG